MSKISFVYFDIGGVVIQDFSSSHKWEHMKEDMGLPVEQDKAYEVYYESIEKDICLGRDVDSYMPEIEAKFGFHFPPGFSMLTYFVDHFNANKSLWPIIEQTKAKVGIGLLTDQYPRMLAEIMKRGLLPPIQWDVIIDSTVERIIKSNPAIFELAAKRAQVKPSEILFVDNNQKNLDVAAKLGWQTHFYSSEDYEKSNQNLSHLLDRSL